MDERKKNKGTIGNKGGRPSKADEQSLIEKLSPLEPKAFLALTEAIEEKKDWAIKLFFQYNFGLPKQVVTQTNINVEAGKLTDEEIKKINDNLERTY
jgi:hypothetical protein